MTKRDNVTDLECRDTTFFTTLILGTKLGLECLFRKSDNGESYYNRKIVQLFLGKKKRPLPFVDSFTFSRKRKDEKRRIDEIFNILKNFIFNLMTENPKCYIHPHKVNH